MGTFRLIQDPNIAMMGLDVLFHNGQPQTGTLNVTLVRNATLIEGLENPVAFICIDTWPFILDIKLRDTLMGGYSYAYPTTDKREFDRVGKQIVNNNLDLLPVGHHFQIGQFFFNAQILGASRQAMIRYH